MATCSTQFPASSSDATKERGRVAITYFINHCPRCPWLRESPVPGRNPGESAFAVRFVEGTSRASSLVKRIFASCGQKDDISEVKDIKGSEQTRDKYITLLSLYKLIPLGLRSHSHSSVLPITIEGCCAQEHGWKAGCFLKAQSLRSSSKLSIRSRGLSESAPRERLCNSDETTTTRT